MIREKAIEVQKGRRTFKEMKQLAEIIGDAKID